MPLRIRSEFTLGDTVARYLSPADQPEQVFLLLLPARRAKDVVTPRETLGREVERIVPGMRAWHADRLVHLHVRGDVLPRAFSAGRSLRDSASAEALRLVWQDCEAVAGRTVIRTRLADQRGLECVHELSHVAGEPGLCARTEVRNTGGAPLTLELLTSFSLGGITPFAADDAPGRLWVHRLRSTWSAEGRHDARLVEELQLERSWLGYGVACERFGQLGTMPVNGWFPQVAIEDRAAGVTWGAQLAHAASWQLEIWRRGDQLALSGGLADREFGHWAKTLAPGESLVSPEALLAVGEGGFDEVCRRLTALHRGALSRQPAIEQTLPVAFNEFCTTWGKPTHDVILKLADRLKGSGVTYLVIDDGWSERPGPGIQQNGDWLVSRTAFPHGLKVVADAIRERGLVPGIWFEFEVVNPGARVWNETSHMLHRDGEVLQVGPRRFWDFRDPWVHDYLGERVIRFLRENGFGYLKVDYNDSVGLGCDGPDAPGENLRQHIAGVHRFFRRLREELPDLVIENCSSGGHRLEPSLLAATALSSFSDAHETPDIPILAANLHRVMLPAQNLIWAVLRKEDSRQRLSYSLAATFLGRMCLSGDVHDLSPESWAFVTEAIAFYRGVAPVIAAGEPRRYATIGPSWQHPEGAQTVVFHEAAGRRALVVWHAFARPGGELIAPLPAGGRWRPERELCDRPTNACIRDGALHLPAPREWSGGVISLVND